MNSEIYWVWFSLVSENFRAKSRRLYKKAGSIEAIYNAEIGEYVNWGITDIRYLKLLSDKSLVAAEKELWYAENYNTEIISADSKNYPEKLKDITDFPLMLYKRGKLPLDKQEGFSVAIVGTREACEEAKNFAYELAFALAKKGIRIISGMAAGIDTAAHMGALDAGGETVAVFGCSVATAFPSSNRSLMQRIADSGCICSEYGFEQAVYPSNFSDRNRIVSALSDVVIVVEAGEKSGSLITARVAAKQGKKLFVSKKALEENGEKLFEDIKFEVVESASSVLEYFGIDCNENILHVSKISDENIQETSGAIDSRRQQILNILEKEAADEEEIAFAVDENPVETGILLTLMEIENLIIRRPDGKYNINK